jgi:hypothetical protein
VRNHDSVHKNLSIQGLQELSADMPEGVSLFLWTGLIAAGQSHQAKSPLAPAGGELYKH